LDVAFKHLLITCSQANQSPKHEILQSSGHPHRTSLHFVTRYKHVTSSP